MKLLIELSTGNQHIVECDHFDVHQVYDYHKTIICRAYDESITGDFSEVIAFYEIEEGNESHPIQKPTDAPPKNEQQNP